MRFILSADMGGRRDYTAVVIIAYNELMARPVYTVTYLHRFPLGTSSVAVVDHLVQLVKTYPLREDVTVVVDATGAGGSVLDLMMRAGLDPIGIKIHGGQSVSRDDFDGCYRTPKRDLVGVVDYLLPQAPEPVRIEIPARLPQSKVLLAELETFRAKITLDTGHTTFEAWRERDHDDYVLALACALWVAEHHQGVPIFAGQFFQHHISKTQLMPEGGRSIVRGWRVREPVAARAYKGRALHSVEEELARSLGWQPILSPDLHSTPCVQSKGRGVRLFSPRPAEPCSVWISVMCCPAEFA